MDRDYRVGAGVYREGAVAPPRERRAHSRVWAGVTLSVGLAAYAGAPRLNPVRRATTSPRRDPAAPGAPVEDSTHIEGGATVCALTRGATGKPQVVCAPPYSDGTALAGASQAWGTEQLVTWALLTPRFSQPWSQPVMGVTTDGRAVESRRGEKAAAVLPLWPTGAHGRILELRASSWTGFVSSGCEAGDFAGFAFGYVARTEDGALLASVLGNWEPVPGAPRGVRSFDVDGDVWYAVTVDGAASSGRLPPPTSAWSYHNEDHPLRAPPQVPDAREIARRGNLLCVRGGGGDVRCLDVAHGVTYDLVHLPGGVRAMALGDDDLCVRAVGGAWWCARGPAAEVRSGELDLRTFRHAPLLAGAEEVALAPGLGCARWPAGAVRCWGPSTRSWPGAPRDAPLVALAR